LRPVDAGDQVVAGRLRAVSLLGHASDHIGYAFTSDDDDFLFFGGIVHVLTMQFGNPAFS
jgi:glyoxylase-like metal-dependent hydrolase (beta-lactamase superfamily II)